MRIKYLDENKKYIYGDKIICLLYFSPFVYLQCRTLWFAYSQSNNKVCRISTIIYNYNNATIIFYKQVQVDIIGSQEIISDLNALNKNCLLWIPSY